MIQTPYKLDFILNTSNNSSYIQTEQNHQTQQTQQNHQTQPEQLANSNKTILSNEINLSNNKFKSIVLNMGLEDIYWLNSNVDSGINFKIKVTNYDRINENNYSVYTLTNGLVEPFQIDKSSDINNYIDFGSEELILQIIDYKINSIQDDFISKWTDDKIKFEQNIPIIYFYGTIYNNSGEFLSYYYLTKKYYNFIDILNQTDFIFSITFFKKLLALLDNVLAHRYVLRNLNMFDLGYEKKSQNNFEIILIKYTNKSLLSLKDNFFTSFDILKCYDKKCIGNLTPYYVIGDYYNINNNWLDRLDKFYSLALVEIILVLFYNNDDNLSKIYDFIVGPSVFEGQLHYYHFYKRFNSEKNVHNLNLLINDLKLRFCDINPLFEYILHSIIINLLDKNYDKIYYPNQILTVIENNEKSNNEFDIKYTSKKKIYNPQDDNYMKINYKIKQNILSNDELKITNSTNSNIPKSNSNLNNLIGDEEITNNISEDIIKIPIKKITYKLFDSNLNNNYHNKYLKYKTKYIWLQKKLKI